MKMDVAKNLKMLREANKFTQEQLANYLGINRSAYANYETGERETPLDVLEKAASLFGCELSMLFEENEMAMKNMLTCAFRVDNISESDLKEVANFKSVVINYLKMNRLLTK